MKRSTEELVDLAIAAVGREHADHNAGHDCDGCIYNQGCDPWPGTRLPCGQFNCWHDLTEDEEEEENE